MAPIIPTSFRLGINAKIISATSEAIRAKDISPCSGVKLYGESSDPNSSLNRATMGMANLIKNSLAKTQAIIEIVNTIGYAQIAFQRMPESLSPPTVADPTPSVNTNAPSKADINCTAASILSPMRIGTPVINFCKTKLVRGMLVLLTSDITSALSERPFKSADQKTERGKILNPEYNIDRDQPTSQASPLIVIRTD